MEIVEHQGKRYVIASDLAAARGVERETVYMAIKRGALPAVLVLGRRLVPEDEANAWQPRQYTKKQTPDRPPTP